MSIYDTIVHRCTKRYTAVINGHCTNITYCLVAIKRSSAKVYHMHMAHAKKQQQITVVVVSCCCCLL